MRGFWHPLSAVLLEATTCFATPRLVQMVWVDGALPILYVGDRMWPAITDGTRLEVERRAESPRPGDVVLALADGVVDVVRVTETLEATLRCHGDADPESAFVVEHEHVLGGIALPSRSVTPREREAHRLELDVREAIAGGPDEAGAESVKTKYDAQADFYVGSSAGMDPDLVRRLESSTPAGGRVLVLGSGVGTECFCLAERGFRVTGVDFAPKMVHHASAEAERRDLSVEFVLGDVRRFGEEAPRFDTVLFTYDVYSFLPDPAERRATLESLRSRLAAPGAVFLSARRVRRDHERTILTLQRVAGKAARQGDSHTRWVDASGRVRRSFVHLFEADELDEEVRSAGFRTIEWQAGHGLLKPA